MVDSRLSVLQKATTAHVETDPFPHVVLHDALPTALYQELASSFPSPDSLGIDSSLNNVRWNYGAEEVAANVELPDVWRRFIAYHASDAFFREVVNLFLPHMLERYPEHFPSKKRVDGFTVGTRHVDTFDRCDILMDAMLSGNTPVTEPGSVRTTHVDLGHKLFSGLFYMKPEGYNAVGGDLTISRFKPQYRTHSERGPLFDGPYVDDSHVEHVKTITYDKNLVVLFLNSLESLHGVTVRQKSEQSRLFVNLVGEIDPPIYTTRRNAGPAQYLSGRRSKLFGRRGVVRTLVQRVTGS